MTPLARAALYAVTAAFLFNLETIMVKAMPAVPVATVVLARALGQFLPLLPALAREGWQLFRTRQPGMQLLRGVLSVSSWGLYYAGFQHLPLAPATVLSFSSVLFVTALAGPLLGERVGWRRWSATVAGFAGVLLILRPGAVPLDWPALAVLGSAAVGGFIVLTTRHLARSERVETIMLYIGIVSLAAALPAALPALAWPGWRDALLLLGVAVTGPAGMLLWIHALRLAEASFVAPLGYTRLVFATLGAVLLFGEAPDAWLFAGAALIIGSAVYITRREARLSAAAADSARPAAGRPPG
jgi:drug/metabolite transporter (DMT)-like permease